MHSENPYQLAFPDAVFEAEHFPAIAEEAERSGVRTSDPHRFLNLRAVAPLLREALSESSHGAIEEFGPLLFQAFHFWRYEKHVFALEEQILRDLLSDSVLVGEWQLIAPVPAGYLQLPRNLVWARIAEDAPAESIDGVFWTMVGTGDPLVPPFDRIDLLMVLGIMTGRPGFSIAEVAVELGDEPQGHWGDARARGQGEDFSNLLPGGEHRRRPGIDTAGEVLKLASRCFWYLSQHPEAWDG